MKFKFRILRTDNNIDPNNFTCGSVFNPIDLADIGLSIWIEGNLMATWAIGALTPGATAGLTVGSLIAAYDNSADYHEIDINVPDRDSISDIRLEITSAIEDTYEATFNVRGFDLGNNPNVVYPLGMEFYTKPIDIHMIPQNWLLPSPITLNKMCAKATVYRSFDDGKICILKTTSSVGTTNYRVPTSTNIIASGEYVEIDNSNDNITQLVMTVSDGVETSTEVLTIPSRPIIKPIMGFSYTNPGCDSCNCLKFDTIIDTTLDVGVIESYLVDDLLIDPFLATLNYNFDLINSETGLIVATSNFSNSPNPALDVIEWPFTPNVYIDPTVEYHLVYTVRDTDIGGDIIQTATFVLDACSKIELTKTDCNTYEWVNKTYAGVTVTLKQMNSAGVLTTIETYSNVALGTVLTFVLADGVYILNVNSGELINFNYKLLSLCTYIECLTKYTKEVACADPCDPTEDCGCEDCADCKDCKDRDVFNLLSFSYLALINKMYIEDTLFLILDTESASTMQDLALLQDRISKYCKGC